MKDLEFNKRYLVSDSSHTVKYEVWFEPSKKYDDMIIVNDELYNEKYYMTYDEINEEFTFEKEVE